MRNRVSVSGASVRTLLLAAFVIGSVSTASAQTTVTLQRSKTEAWYATVRGGTYANTNIANLLETRKSNDLTYHRNAMLKFDTHSTIPAGTAITSAHVTVTVSGASADATRRVGIYPVTTSWDDTQVTWNIRRTGLKWVTRGGDFGQKITEKVVGNVVGTRVTFDITSYVRQVVAGALGSSRYARIALVDLDESTKESYRSYGSSGDLNAASRPTLVVTYGGTVAPPPPPPVPTSGEVLRVLHYNIGKNGWGTDGLYDPLRVANWVVSMNPDIISFNEIEKWNQYSLGLDGIELYKNLLEAKTGATWYTWDVQDYGIWDDKGLRSAIFSKIPFTATYRTIYSAGKLKTAGGVTINFNGRNINVMTTHFDPYTASYRLTQARDLVTYTQGFTENQIIGGDFNDQSTDPPITTMTASFYDAWAEAKKSGIAFSAPDNPYGNTRSSRIDYIFYPRRTNNLTLKKITVVDTRDANGVMPSDHRPVLAEFIVN